MSKNDCPLIDFISWATIQFVKVVAWLIEFLFVIIMFKKIKKKRR